MNQGHVNQIVNAVRGQRVFVEPFASLLPSDWVAWRSNFEITARIAGWDNYRNRLEVGRSMRGKAKNVVGHIDLGVDHNNPDAAQNVAGLLDLYEAVFVPAAATDAARAKVRTIRQDEGESMLEWLTKLVYHFRRAHPDLNNQQIQASGDLKDLFIRGLTNRETRKATCWSRPATVQAAYEAAMSVEGASEMFDLGDGPSVNAMVQEGTSQQARKSDGNDQKKVATLDGNRRCWTCGKKGHLSKNCWKRKPYQKGNGQGKNGGQGYKGKKWSGKKNNGNGNSRYSVNAIEGEGRQEQEEEDDQEPDYNEAYGNQDNSGQKSGFQ